MKTRRLVACPIDGWADHAFRAFAYTGRGPEEPICAEYFCYYLRARHPL